MATIHFILQGKGGVGKSMIAVMLYQALRHFGKDVLAYDTDPVNATLASFKEFSVTSLDVMKDGNIEPRKFDVLLEALVTAPEEAHVIVDNGASSFIALGAYLQENDVLALLEEAGHTVFFHSIVTGGQALGDTLHGLSRMCVGFPDSPIVVWLNPYFGDIAVDGKGFEEFKIYENHSRQFHALVVLPQGNKALIGKDLEELFAKRQSFEAGINASSTSIAVKARLRRYWNQILSCVEQAGIC
ncbi:nucleotide-binding protein [Desulfovibrio legallii]|uniref:CobQ/CobB/MinD/ParA nucleotide binding domain-containing protein n=1 Tax=Desulfovibrio legallii TaxID=571438 RepID=A0A1G7KBC6_9BACT|nr:conjugal transfer protein TraL [Desulfovibrio legallii]SDF34284.1 CobQ/CobB/MinD/ParA nucleotide binding domain-containing protein [Desulfovibrio legallii]